MLKLSITLKDGFDEATNKFVPIETVEIEMLHSLVSLSKWESKWQVPFLHENKDFSAEMYMDYFRCMLQNPEDERYLERLSQPNITKINEYINSKESAAWFNDKTSSRQPGGRGTIITSDLIYYWMVALQIPFTCETWHLNRLLTLIKITELENRPKKKMSQRETMANHRSILAKRRAMLDNNKE